MNNLISDNDESIWNIGFQLDSFIRCADVEYNPDEKRLIIESHEVEYLYDSGFSESLLKRYLAISGFDLISNFDTGDDVYFFRWIIDFDEFDIVKDLVQIRHLVITGLHNLYDQLNYVDKLSRVPMLNIKCLDSEKLDTKMSYMTEILGLVRDTNNNMYLCANIYTVTRIISVVKQVSLDPNFKLIDNIRNITRDINERWYEFDIYKFKYSDIMRMSELIDREFIDLSFELEYRPIKIGTCNLN